MEAQNNFINAITNEEPFVQVQTENKRRNVVKTTPNPIISNTSGFPSKSLIAEEFNRANYMYGNEEEKKQTMISPKTPKSAKLKSILKHRRTLKSIQMGFAPDTFERKITFIHNKQKQAEEIIRSKNKEISFIIPENNVKENDNKNKKNFNNYEQKKNLKNTF